MENEPGWRETGRPNPSREIKFSGANGDGEMFIFPVQLTTSSIGNLTRSIHNLVYVMTIRAYIHTEVIMWYLCTYTYIILVTTVDTINCNSIP